MVGLKRAVCFRYQTINAREFHETLQCIYRHKEKVQQKFNPEIFVLIDRYHDGDAMVM